MNKIIVVLIALIGFSGCTDISENVYDKYSAEEFYSTPEGANAALASVYAQIPGDWGGVGYAGADNGWYDINSMTTDEQVIPHRNTGDWQLDFAYLYQREWQPSLSLFNNAWNWLYKSVFLSNLAIEQLTIAGADQSVIAEAKVLRAFFYYMLIDGYGDVPFYTENNLTVSEITQKSREEVFNFIEDELLENIDLLSAKKGGDYYGRFNKWAGYSLLAKLYLNAEVYTGTARWQDCLDACSVIDSGSFTLHSGEESTHPLESEYYELFGDICPEDETILAIYTTADVVGRNIFSVRSFWGDDATKLFGFGGWNGTIVPEDYVAKFDDNDIRKRQFRYGNDPYGPQPEGFVEYQIEIDNLTNPGADVDAGARSMKFWPVPPMNSGGASNDFPIFRYADIKLMKAECYVRTGQSDLATSLVTDIRERAGLEALPAAPTLDNIYDERGFELSWECHRRQDMIRFGKFTEARGTLVPEVGDKFLLFPIPTDALNANPLLTQNPGW